MPIVRNYEETDQIGLEELVAFMHDNKIDPRGHDDLLAAGPALRRLANNRTFLADIALEELKSRKTLDGIDNSYSPQTIMLFNNVRAKYFIRANFWPSERDHIFKSTGASSFFYYEPHDHSFNFLTVGYVGPGYKSNYYEYDYTAVAGYPGEKVDMRFVEHSALNEGKVMLYRAFTDVHDQRPGDDMSISINIMENSFRGSFMDQYSFDVDKSEISAIINRIGATSLLPIIAACGSEDTKDFLAETVRTHCSGRVRCVALSSLASMQPNINEARSVFETGTRSDMDQVRGYAQKQLSILEPLHI